MNRHGAASRRLKGTAILTLILSTLWACGSGAPPSKGSVEKAGIAAEKQAESRSGAAAKEADSDKKKARDENIIKALEKVSKDTE